MELESRKIRFNTPDNIATVLKKLENIVFKIPTLANINKPTIEEKT